MHVSVNILKHTYTHTKWIASFESVNCMACESYLIKLLKNSQLIQVSLYNKCKKVFNILSLKC